MPNLKIEPCRLIRWNTRDGKTPGALFTCGRPGRTLGRKRTKIADETVHAWVRGLPADANELVIVSLLGSKPQGLSEFSYYSFRGSFEKPDARLSCGTFQEWLDKNYGPGRYRVCEYPTIDTELLSEDFKHIVSEIVASLLTAKKTVVIVDSGGYSRTGAIVERVGSQMGVRFVEQYLTATCP